MIYHNVKLTETCLLGDPARVVVIGGGPAGSFFAIEALKEARQQGRELEVLIIEQKHQLHCDGAPDSAAHREGCNYCAGGISPRLVDILEDSLIALPPEVIQSRVESVTIQGSWKHIELRVPPGRKMLTVYRGSGPCAQLRMNANFDSYLLECALASGAQIITGQTYGVQYSPTGKPVVNYTLQEGHEREDRSLEADFVVVAGGVNQVAGMSLANSPLIKTLCAMIPKFSPPRVRKALICELETNKGATDFQNDEVYFIQYGSKNLHIEMSSLLPKGEGHITLAMLGKSVDHARSEDRMELIRRFLELPHLRRLLPQKLGLKVICACFPSMTVGTARRPFSDRIAIIGDLAVSRLYKDGILSANSTARALAACILRHGIDSQSLKEYYWPTVESFKKDNRFGKVVFFLNRTAFSHHILSRTLYQAVLTERRSKREADRYLENLLWRIASGDDTYKSIFRSMLMIKTFKGVLIGGVLFTIRNYLTELLFGLRWGDIGRYPTGIYCEVMEAKRADYADKLTMPDSTHSLDVESMYSIRIRTDRNTVFEQLAKFGEQDMGYFRPRIVKIRKLSGNENEVGKIIQYDLPFPFLRFSIVLEAVTQDGYIVYRVRDGFAAGGVLVFDVEKTSPGVSVLSIYVAFNFPRGNTKPQKAMWKLFKMLFPQYIHDVLWNFALCQLKDIAES